MSAQKKVQEQVKIYHPNSCPPPLDAGHMVVMGEPLHFGNLFIDFGITFMPIGSGIMKVIANHLKSFETPYGFWDAGLRRAVFCNQDHPGLLLYFLFIHRYTSDNNCHRHYPGQPADHPWRAADHIVNICFPWQNGVPDVQQETFGFTFKGFLELMVISGKLGKQEMEAIRDALQKRKGEQLKRLEDATTERRKDLIAKELKERPDTTIFDPIFKKDKELVRYSQYTQAINDEFAPAETALARAPLSPAPSTPQE